MDDSAPFAVGWAWPRVGLKVVWIFAWTAALAAVLALAWLPTLPLAARGPRTRAAARRGVYGVWARGMLRTIGVRVSSEGTPPPPATLIVSNHLSYLDIVVLASRLPIVFVSKAEVRRWPFWGLMATMGGTVFIDRARSRDTVRVLAEMQTAFDRGDGVVIFPEATSTEGATIRPFKSSLLATAASEGNPVHWVTVTYRTRQGDPSARERVCWWGDMGFVRHFLGLCALRRIDCSLRYGDRPVRSNDRKDLADSLRRSMLQRFEPVP